MVKISLVDLVNEGKEYRISFGENTLGRAGDNKIQIMELLHYWDKIYSLK